MSEYFLTPRYEDLAPEYRSRLRPNKPLIELTKNAFDSAKITGGIRFAPIFGDSGAGKTCATLELDTHLPDVSVVVLEREHITSREALVERIQHEKKLFPQKKIVCVVDQYEEAVATREDIPTQFVETLSLVDRAELRRESVLFFWLTTSKDFQKRLADATTRNRRILVSPDFEISGPTREDWTGIILETFEVHNNNMPLADFQVLESDIDDAARLAKSIGETIEHISVKLRPFVEGIHDLSQYQVIMLWPVTDGTRISRIQQFSDPKQGYKLDWNAWYRQLNSDEAGRLPLQELNKARLYFDMRLVPIAAADLKALCKDLEQESMPLHKSYLERFEKTHFVTLLKEQWDASTYRPLRERESQRADDARDWYEAVTDKPTQIGRRIALILQSLGFEAKHEQDVSSPSSRVRADVLVNRKTGDRPKVIVELKAYSPKNTMPSTICSAVRTTLRRHAELVGYLTRA